MLRALCLFLMRLKAERETSKVPKKCGENIIRINFMDLDGGNIIFIFKFMVLRTCTSFF